MRLVILPQAIKVVLPAMGCLLYTSDAADDMQCVDLGGRRIIKKIICILVYSPIFLQNKTQQG